MKLISSYDNDNDNDNNNTIKCPCGKLGTLILKKYTKRYQSDKRTIKNQGSWCDESKKEVDVKKQLHLNKYLTIFSPSEVEKKPNNYYYY